MEENKYKAALERAKSAIKECGDNIGRIRMIESIFPELAESKEENIRKSILMMFKNALPDVFNRYGINKNDAIAYMEKLKDIDKQLEDAYKNSDEVQYKRGYDDGYLEGIVNAKKELEKQGEMDIEMDIEKPITIGKRRAVSGKLKELIDNKDPKSIEETKEKMLEETAPKFKVGDWVVNDYCAGKVIALTDDAYLLDSGQGIPFSCEHNAHLWTDLDSDKKKGMKLLIGDFEPELSRQEMTEKSEQDKWSEEDERLFNSVYNTLEGIAPLSYEKEVEWLKSIKTRLQ